MAEVFGEDTWSAGRSRGVPVQSCRDTPCIADDCAMGAAATRVTDRDWRSVDVTSVNVTSVDVTVASVDNNDNDDGVANVNKHGEGIITMT